MLLRRLSEKMEKGAGEMTFYRLKVIGDSVHYYLSPSPTASFLRARQKILYKFLLNKAIYTVQTLVDTTSVGCAGCATCSLVLLPKYQERCVVPVGEVPLEASSLESLVHPRHVLA